MIDAGKSSVLGVMVDAVDYEAAVSRIIDAAHERKPYAVAALSVHGVMTGVSDRELRYRLNHIDLVTPDGQPVRWALNLLYKRGLPDRVYGPKLTRLVCARAEAEGLGIFLYGSDRVLDSLVAALRRDYPELRLVGWEAAKFRRTTHEERDAIVKRISSSGAHVVLVGLGCPRQETFVYEYKQFLSMPLLAVGAAFDYLAGARSEPSETVQRLGLQWAYRLLQEPRRLWRRYLVLNPLYLGLLACQKLRLWTPRPDGSGPPSREELYG